MSHFPTRAPVFCTAAAALVGVAALAGCTGSSPSEEISAPAPSTAVEVTDPAIIDDVEGQTGDVAPTADPAVVLTHAAFDEDSRTIVAAAYFAGVVEEGGSCVLTARQDGAVAEATTGALPTAATTDCGNLAVEVPAGAEGGWEVAVTYTSPTHTGTSRVETVELP